MSTLRVDEISARTGTGDIQVVGGRIVSPGAVIQTVYAELKSSFSGTSVSTGTGYYIDVTGLSATITPVSASSNILILTNMYVGHTTTSSGYQTQFRVKRTIAGVAAYPIVGNQEGTRPRTTGRINMYTDDTYSMAQFSGVHQDSPATILAVTYQIQLGGYSAAPVVYVNRAETFQDGGSVDTYDGVPVSTITLMEIAQ